MRTIIQHIGPLYGEANTGTVFGQPNGSIAVGQGYSPAPTPDPTPVQSDLWTISKTDYFYLKTKYDSTTKMTSFIFIKYTTDTKGGNRTAGISVVLNETIADTTQYMKYEFASDSSFSTILATATQPAGQFSGTQYAIFGSLSGQKTYTTGTKFYLRASLMKSDGTAVGRYSNTLEYVYQGAIS